MEKRKIHIHDTERNSVITLETDATTFGEVKQAAQAAGVNIAGKDWLEGLTRTTPTADDSLLPTNIPYKGTVTNELVFVVTNTNKRVKSGTMTYNEMKAYIKANNLTEEFQKKYKKNYTQGKTSEFSAFIAAHQKKAAKVAVATPTPTTAPAEKPVEEPQPKMETPVIPALAMDDNADYKAKYTAIVNGIASLMVAAGADVCTDIDNAVAALITEKEKSTPKPLNLSIEEIKNIRR